MGSPYKPRGIRSFAWDAAFAIILNAWRLIGAIKKIADKALGKALDKAIGSLVLTVTLASTAMGATITGTVTGPDGKPFMGAFVVAENPQS